ncbi:hypothetical protein B0H17DRAFT_1132958 [Mycena rosella]|uniref:Uncharacterized protein n=1 Tax=Mycena rosella TaxID=1033263 RepID=A0AAD7GIN9_MYCRO|nr:hypothetical protein B0H17DRAFT_1132958 [Mycena rosella]
MPGTFGPIHGTSPQTRHIRRQCTAPGLKHKQLELTTKIETTSGSSTPEIASYNKSYPLLSLLSRTVRGIPFSGPALLCGPSGTRGGPASEKILKGGAAGAGDWGGGGGRRGGTEGIDVLKVGSKPKNTSMSKVLKSIPENSMGAIFEVVGGNSSAGGAFRAPKGSGSYEGMKNSEKSGVG